MQWVASSDMGFPLAWLAGKGKEKGGKKERERKRKPPNTQPKTSLPAYYS
jgi:hypothetical protein